MRKTDTCAQWLAGCLIAALVLLTAATAARGADVPDKFAMHETPRTLGPVTFSDEHGNPVSLSDFRGQIVLLNLWATWCGPCREEMPTLDRLQARLGGPDFRVVALSVDRAGLDPVRKFLAEIGIRHLGIYIDQSSKSMFDLRARGLPTTLLIDRSGRELGRLVGPAEWDADHMVRFLMDIIDRAEK